LDKLLASLEGYLEATHSLPVAQLEKILREQELKPEYAARLAHVISQLTEQKLTESFEKRPEEDQKVLEDHAAITAMLASARLPARPRSSDIPLTGDETLQIEAFLDLNQRPSIDALQQYLTSLQGRRFASGDDAKRFVVHLNRVLDRIDRRLECPHCSEPAILRVDQSRGKDLIRFQHPEGRRKSRHGQTTGLPLLVLTTRPPDRRVLYG
jgi:hypothetical protein